MRSQASLERSRKTSREAKRRRRGRCVDCGAETRYNGDTVNGPSLRCRACAVRRLAAERVGQGREQRRLRELLADGPLTRRELLELGVCSGNGNSFNATVHRAIRQGWLRRVGRGRYDLAAGGGER